MVLWVVLTVVTALIASALTIFVVRRHDAQRARAAAAIGSEPALRTHARALPWVVLGVAALGLAGGILYLAIDHSDLPPDSQLAADLLAKTTQTGPANHPVSDVDSMIAGLEAKLKQEPNNAEGWWMLGWSYMRIGRPSDAVNAYGRAVALAPGNADYLSAQAEAMVQAAAGKVSPDAQAIFRKVLAAAPADPRARYYLAVFKDQNGDAKGAMADWIALLKSAPPDATWAPEIREFVEKVARERGLNIAAQLPPLPAAAAPATASAAPGPNAAQIAAANQLTDGDRQAMINGMVEKLAVELKANPRNANGWVQLMRSRMVLGQKDQAAQAYQDARKAFGDKAPEQTVLRDAARTLGIPN